jgi:metallo-beta-lactamase family protein
MNIPWRLLLYITALSVFIAMPSWVQASTSLQFLGTARTVGGSAILLETGKSRILIDFGSFMSSDDRFRNNIMTLDPSVIDYVLLTHAHGDHGGRIPMLFRKGFRGKVIGTGATKSLSRLTLGAGLDYADRDTVSPFGSQDVAAMMKNFISLPYDRKMDLTPDIAVRFRDAGHILGSAMIEVWCKEGEKTIKIVFTGDMGNTSIPLLKAPFEIRDGDYVIVEATYGASQRTINKAAQFGAELLKTLQGGGSVLVPAFSLDRTQKVLFMLGRLKREGIIPEETPVYADSGMARRITRVYRQYGQLFHPEARKLADYYGDLFIFPGLHDVSGVEALQAHNLGQPSIYVTSSGMLDHGNAPHHLEKMSEDCQNLLAIVGWQAPGSLGSRLLAGEKRVWIPIRSKGEWHAREGSIEKDIRMSIMQFDFFANHADACQILNWLAGFGKTREVFVVHGDEDNTVKMAQMINRNLGFKAVAPELNDRIVLSADEEERNLKTGTIPCAGLGGGVLGKGMMDF